MTGSAPAAVAAALGDATRFCEVEALSKLAPSAAEHGHAWAQARELLAAQQRLLDGIGDRSPAGRIASAGLVAANVLRSFDRTSAAERIAAVTRDCVARGDAADLRRALAAALADDATIIAHDNVRRRMAEGHPSIAGRPVPPAPAEALPVITFDDSLTVHVNGEEIRALHYAHGHTDGDSVIFFPKANVVHMGDDFVTYGLPFVDVASGGRLRGMIENVEKAMAAVPDDVKVRLQAYVSGCYGTLTSFNVLFADEQDHFKGSGGETA